MAENTTIEGEQKSRLYWARRGAFNIVSLPALILVMSFVGFGGLTAEAGLTVWQAMFLGLSTWALPSAVVVAGAIIKDVPFYATVIAVILASIRLLPMTMALVPVLKSEQTKLSTLLFASYFVAVTSWVFAMNELPRVPRSRRVAFFLGFALTLAVVNTVVLGIAHSAVPNLPASLAAGLIFLTPIYFLVSMTQTARLRSEYLAIAFGLVLGPSFHLVVPETDLLLAGLIGGSVAYALGRYVDRKGRTP